MEITKTFHAKDRERWRSWLGKNHKKATEIWLIFFKKHTGKPGIDYADAVEEALCFGWIDGIVKRVDEEKYAQRFSPRKKNSMWSELNRQRVKKMIAQGRMTDVGLAKYQEDSGSEKGWRDRLAGAFEMPADIQAALSSNSSARRNFERFPAGYRRLCIGWIISAKKQETRRKRIREVVALTAENKRIGLK